MQQLIDALSQLTVSNAAQFDFAAENLNGKLGVIFAVQNVQNLFEITTFSHNRVELVDDKNHWIRLIGESNYQLLITATLEYIPEESSVVCWIRDIPDNPRASFVLIAISDVAQIEA